MSAHTSYLDFLSEVQKVFGSHIVESNTLEELYITVEDFVDFLTQSFDLGDISPLVIQNNVREDEPLRDIYEAIFR
jgi:hypothetical protein